MNVLELIEKCDFCKVCEAWDKEFNSDKLSQNHASEKIPEFLDIIKKIEPKKTEFSVVLDRFSDDEETYVSVSGIKPGSDEKWAMELSSNAEWLAFEIVNNIEELTIEEQLIYILWEMTFVGWFDDERNLFKNSLNDRCDEVNKCIGEGTIEEHTSSYEEVLENLCKSNSDVEIRHLDGSALYLKNATIIEKPEMWFKVVTEHLGDFELNKTDCEYICIDGKIIYEGK